MNGKDYVKETIERAGKVIGEIKSEGALEGDNLLEELGQAHADLDGLKNKPSLRTKDGTNSVFPVLEAGNNLEEEWESARGGDDMGDLKIRIEEFVDAVNVLAGALKSRTVIMT